MVAFIYGAMAPAWRSMQTPDAVGAGRNSDCGFSPTPFWPRPSKKWVSRVMLSAVPAPVLACIVLSQATHPRSRVSANMARRIAHGIAQFTRGFAEPEKTCEFVCANCHRVRPSRGER